MSIVPHDWIPLVYADRHGNLKLSQAAMEIARQLSPPAELLVGTGCSYSSAKLDEQQFRERLGLPEADSRTRQQIDEWNQYVKEQPGLVNQTFDQWRKARYPEFNDGDGDSS